MKTKTKSDVLVVVSVLTKLLSFLRGLLLSAHSFQLLLLFWSSRSLSLETNRSYMESFESFLEVLLTSVP